MELITWVYRLCLKLCNIAQPCKLLRTNSCTLFTKIDSSFVFGDTVGASWICPLFPNKVYVIEQSRLCQFNWFVELRSWRFLLARRKNVYQVIHFFSIRISRPFSEVTRRRLSWITENHCHADTWVWRHLGLPVLKPGARPATGSYNLQRGRTAKGSISSS